MVTALLAETASLQNVPEPTSYKKAVDPNNPERELWIASIKRELDTLIDRNTWSYVDKHLIPKGEDLSVANMYSSESLTKMAPFSTKPVWSHVASHNAQD